MFYIFKYFFSLACFCLPHANLPNNVVLMELFCKGKFTFNWVKFIGSLIGLLLVHLVN